jgi:sugar lactone lactonase YvrE
MKKILRLSALVSSLFLIGLPLAKTTGNIAKLESVGFSDSLFNVVSVSKNGRVFVSFPRLSDAVTPVVGEVMKDGTIRAYPGGDWNAWAPGVATDNRFVHAHTVQVDRDDNLWVVDQGNEAFGMPSLPGGPKLVQIDLQSNQVKRVYTFDPSVVSPAMNLNDVQVYAGFAYISDHGIGSIVVLDLNTGKARRLLEKSPSTKSNPAIVPVVEGKPMRGSDGSVPQINVNPIAISPDGVWLYYQATWGPDLMRIRTADLRNAALTEDQLERKVENAGKSVPTGGMSMDNRGILYLGDMEKSAVTLRCPNRKLVTLVQDSRLSFPDGGKVGRDGYYYFPATQINRLPGFNGGVDGTSKPFRIYRVDVKANPCRGNKL